MGSTELPIHSELTVTMSQSRLPLPTLVFVSSINLLPESVDIVFVHDDYLLRDYLVHMVNPQYTY